MQKKTTTMTSAGIRDTGHKSGSESSLSDPAAGDMVVISTTVNCNTLPLQISGKDNKVNGGTKSVKFSTLPSSNKGVFNNQQS